MSRSSLIGIGPSVSGDDTMPEPRFGTMAYLYNYPEVNSGGSYEANVEDLNNFFMPGGSAIDPRFGIKDSVARQNIIDYVKQAIRNGGDLTKDEQDKIFEMAWKQGLIEEEKEYDPQCGASGLIAGLFDEASGGL